MVRAVVLLPWAIPGAVAGILWMWIFHGQFGVLNIILYKLGIIQPLHPLPHRARPGPVWR